MDLVAALKSRADALHNLKKYEGAKLGVSACFDLTTAWYEFRGVFDDAKNIGNHFLLQVLSSCTAVRCSCAPMTCGCSAIDQPVT